MRQDKGVSADADRAGALRAEPAAQSQGIRPLIADARTRRTISPFSTAPRDGTAFHLLHTARFNPVIEAFEVLFNEGGRRVWRAVAFANEPSVWCRLVPLPYSIPEDGWFSIEYAVRCLAPRRAPWWKRAWTRMLRRAVSKTISPEWLAWRAYAPASGIVTPSGDETRSGSVERSEIEPGGVAATPKTPSFQNPKRSHD